MALDDVKHVEAHALIKRMIDEAPVVSPELVAAGEQWLTENHPSPAAYVAAMRSLGSED